MKGNIHSIETFGSVDGPGIRFVVFLQGCPLRCVYCHNPDTWDLSDNTLMDVDELMLRFQRNAAFYRSGGITVTGGEPLLQIDFLIELFTKAHKKSIHTCIDTSGICFDKNNKEFLQKLDQLLQVTDLVMLDIKHINSKKHKEITGQGNENILAFAEYLSRHNKELYIRHVVVPNLTDDPDDLFKLGEFIGGLRSLKALDILPYHDMGTIKYEALNIPYRLKNTPNMDKNKAIELKKYVLLGIKSAREQVNS